MKLWKDMTDQEKGAILLARYDGKEIQFYDIAGEDWRTTPAPKFRDNSFIRVKPEPKRETVVLFGHFQNSGLGFRFFQGQIQYRKDNYKITFDVVDGVPDCASIKMEKL